MFVYYKNHCNYKNRKLQYKLQKVKYRVFIEKISLTLNLF